MASTETQHSIESGQKKLDTQQLKNLGEQDGKLLPAGSADAMAKVGAQIVAGQPTERQLGNNAGSGPSQSA